MVARTSRETAQSRSESRFLHEYGRKTLEGENCEDVLSSQQYQLSFFEMQDSICDFVTAKQLEVNFGVV